MGSHPPAGEPAAVVSGPQFRGAGESGSWVLKNEILMWRGGLGSTLSCGPGSQVLFPGRKLVSHGGRGWKVDEGGPGRLNSCSRPKAC